jgi:hypothetical protein
MVGMAQGRKKCLVMQLNIIRGSCVIAGDTFKQNLFGAMTLNILAHIITIISIITVHLKTFNMLAVRIIDIAA